MSSTKQVSRRRSLGLLCFVAGMILGSPVLGQEGYARAGWVADIPLGFHAVQAEVTIVDDHTLQVEHFTFDGNAPAVYFYLGASDDDSAFANGLQLEPHLDRAYNDESLVLTLPPGEILDGYNAISVWCVTFQANFSSAPFLEPEQPAVPAVAGWGLAVLTLLLCTSATLMLRRHP